MKRPGIIILTPLLPSILLLSCDSHGVGPKDPITELPRVLTVAEGVVIDHSNLFGFDLLREVDGARNPETPNTLLSPLSATMALGMALEGADGETFTAMKEALRFHGLTREEINASYRGLLDLLPELDSEVELTIANSTWSREGFPFHASFFDAVTASFDGTWTTQFKPSDTQGRAFRLETGEDVTVPTMSAADLPIRMGGADGIQIAELPYGREAFAMVLAVPPEGQTVGDLVKDLDQGTWDRWMDALSDREVPVRLPKFEMEWDGMLKDALASMGMGPAFVPQADFSRMTPALDAHISAVRQKTFMKVDEKGTVAAAVTSVTVGTTSAPQGFHVDRPFLVAIRERLSGSILFLGVIRDPR
jgi:serpin B